MKKHDSGCTGLVASRLVAGDCPGGGLAAAGTVAAKLQWVQKLGISSLILAMLFGFIAGNTVLPAAARIAAGVDFSKSTLLRAGIVLYGFRITFQQIADIGWAGMLIDALMVGLTFLLAVRLGTRVFGLDRQTSILIGAGSAICGAAAVVATEPVIRGQPHDTLRLSSFEAHWGWLRLL
jgi:uncharacterized integral membrane protein (TIGR00698 family)